MKKQEFEELRKILKEMNKKSGVTIISATHDMKMLSVSDRIVWIRDGRIAKIERREDLNIEIGTIDGLETGGVLGDEGKH